MKKEKNGCIAKCAAATPGSISSGPCLQVPVVPYNATHLPRFFIHPTIQVFVDAILAQTPRHRDSALLFPSVRIATQCGEFLLRQRASREHEDQSCSLEPRDRYALAELVVPEALKPVRLATNAIVAAAVIFFPQEDAPTASKFWQHTGEGISSRRAEFFLSLFKNGDLQLRWLKGIGPGDRHTVCKGPRRYQKLGPSENSMQAVTPEDRKSGHGPVQSKTAVAEDIQYIEERFGRNLNASLALDAKQAIQRRIAATLFTDSNRSHESPISTPKNIDVDAKITGESDVLLFPTGMSAIFNVHRMVLDASSYMKCVMYGYVGFIPA